MLTEQEKRLNIEDMRKKLKGTLDKRSIEILLKELFDEYGDESNLTNEEK